MPGDQGTAGPQPGWLPAAFGAVPTIAGATAAAATSESVPPLASGLAVSALAVALVSLCWCIARAMSPRRHGDAGGSIGPPEPKDQRG
jgi:hypothetical protein